MNKIKEFSNEKFGTVRTITIDNVTCFVATDIAKSLGYKNPQKAIRDHCKRVNEAFIPSNGGKQKAKIIAKSDIYRLIVRSKLESADDFESWVFDKIIPTIENTGAYIEEGREQEMIQKYFPSFSQEVQTEMVNDLIRQNKELKEFYDDLMNTEGLMSINTMAKELSIGEYTLFAYLRGKKVFFYDKDMVNVPYERFRKEGKFAVKETPCHDGNIRSVTYATKKGLEYVRKLLRKDGYYDAEVA